MTKLSLVAAALWQEEARRSGTFSVAKRRTPEAFQQEAVETQDRWLGLARVAMDVIELKEASNE
jgi:hypothetical protein